MSNVSIIGKGPQTRGTQVLVDGVHVKGVTKIELTAEVNSTWKAVIHCIAKEVDVTDMDSNEIEFLPTHKQHSLPEGTSHE